MIYSKINKKDFEKVRRNINGVVKTMGDNDNIADDLLSLSLSEYEARGRNTATIKINKLGRFEAVCW